MICKNCNAEIPDNGQFCQNCGTKVENANSGQSGSQAVGDSNSFLELNQLLLVHKARIGVSESFSIEDSSGNKFGEAQNVRVMPLKWIVVNSNGSTSFMVESIREKGLLYYEHIDGPDGSSLAIIKRKASFLGNKLELETPSNGTTHLSSDGLGKNFTFTDQNGNATASAKHYSGLTESKTEVNISPENNADHRIILGAMLYMSVLTMKNMSRNNLTD